MIFLCELGHLAHLVELAQYAQGDLSNYALPVRRMFEQQYARLARIKVQLNRNGIYNFTRMTTQVI